MWVKENLVIKHSIQDIVIKKRKGIEGKLQDHNIFFFLMLGGNHQCFDKITALESDDLRVY